MPIDLFDPVDPGDKIRSSHVNALREAVASIPDEIVAALALDGTPAAAAAAAVTSAIAGRNIVETRAILELGILWAVLSSTGQESWLGIASDGGPTDTAVRKIGEHIKGATPQEALASGLLLAFISGSGQLSEFAIGLDGRFQDWVLRDWKRRMDAPVMAIVAYGDSLTQGTGAAVAGWPDRLATLTGLPVINNGIGGDTSAGIAARQNGQPFLLMPSGGTFPASGTVPVDVTTVNAKPFNNPRTFVGTVAGIRGELRAVGGGPYTYVFEQKPTGVATTVIGPQRFYTEEGKLRRDYIHIIFAGSNNSDDPDQVVADVAAMVRYLPTGARYLVVGPLLNAAWTIGTTRYTQNVDIWTRLLAAYGNRFVNLQWWLVNYGLQMAGLTATSQDTTDIANGITPSSLRFLNASVRDAIHLNDFGYQDAALVFATRLRELELVP